MHTSQACASTNPRFTLTGEVDLNAQPKIEIVQNAPEWKYVERILPQKLIPKPAPKAEYPSGWTPQTEEANKYPYFVCRSRNYMVPVYLEVGFRGMKKETVIRHINGDIWALNKELTDYIEYYMARKARSKVNEYAQKIVINGDHVNLLKDYLIRKGF